MRAMKSLVVPILTFLVGAVGGVRGEELRAVAAKFMLGLSRSKPKVTIASEDTNLSSLPSWRVY